MLPRDPEFDKSAPAWHGETLRIDKFTAMELRIYGRRDDRENRPLVLYFHGGSFVSGTLASAYAVAQLLAEAGAIVVSLDYPLAPFPAAIEAGHAALAWIARRGNRGRLGTSASKLFVAGEEAGGNIAAAVAMMARDRLRPRLHGQILISPMLNPWLATASMRNANAGTAGCSLAAGWHHYLADPNDAQHPYASPGTAQRLAGLPPALLLTAQDDPMHDDGIAYAQRLREAGVPARGVVLPGQTGWPCALASEQDFNAPWSDTVRQRLRHFFASIDATQPASTSHASFSL